MEKQHFAIYLAGSIQKSHEKESQIFWTYEDMDFLREGMLPYHLSFLNPASRLDDLSDQYSVFGRDMTQVFASDAVFVDARERRGLGVGAEMMWAKMNRIPVVTLAPRNSHYTKDSMSLLGVGVENWVHPFVESLSDAVVEDLEEGIAFFKRLLSNQVQVKGPEMIQGAMTYYLQTQFPQDEPMKDLFDANPNLKQKVFS